MAVVIVLFGVLLTVYLADSQTSNINVPNVPVITGFVSTPTLYDTITLTCTATVLHTNDLPLTFAWRNGGVFLAGTTPTTNGLETSSTAQLYIASTDMMGQRIVCRVNNTLGERETFETIRDVYQRPAIGAITPGASYYDTGSTGTWTLDIDDVYPGLNLALTPRLYIDGTQETSGFTTVSTGTDNAARAYNYRTTVTRFLSPSDHDVEIRLEVDHETGIQTRTTRMVVRHLPTDLSIETNFENGGVLENTMLRANCSCKVGYPNATLTWSGATFSVTSAFTSGNRHVAQFGVPATVDLIGRTFTCTVDHALGQIPQSVVLQQVFVPPGAITISGFKSVLVEGEVMSLTCTTQRAIPSANVTWTLPDGSFDTSYIANNWNRTWTESVNTLNYTAHFRDNGRTFNCTAANDVLTVWRPTQPIIVYVQPTVPNLFGASEVYDGIAVNYTCETPRTNPESTLSWYLASIPMSATYQGPPSLNGDGTVRTSSTITIMPTAAHNGAVVQCEAAHITLSQSLTDSITITVRLKPSIVLTSPPSTNVLLTTTHSIECDVTSDIPFNITWFHESPSGAQTIITAANSKYIIWNKTSSTQVLSIQNYQSSDDGRYYAVAANHAGESPPSSKASTTGYAIPQIPLIDLNNFNYYPVSGSFVTMNCSSSGGVPNTVVRWYRNDLLEDSSWITVPVNGVDVSYNEYSHNVSVNDRNAVFKCEAGNTFGNTSTVITFVDVYVTPSDPIITGLDVVLENHTYSWICSTSDSNPVAMISWAHGGEDVTSQVTVRQEDSTEKPGTFNVYSTLTLHMERTDVNKILTCFVHHVTLPDSPLSTDLPLAVFLIPTVYVAEQNTEAEIGTISVLTCNVDTQLTATVTWYKTGSALPLQHNQMNYVISGRTLTFNPVILAHEGSYMCSASNNAGSSGLSAAVDFIVYRLPSVPVITLFPVTAIEGEIVSINVTSSNGYPEPTLKWSKGVVAIDNTSTTVNGITYNDYFFVASLSDIGVPYTAKVSNIFGNFSASRSLTDVYVSASAPAIAGDTVVLEGTPTTHQCLSLRGRPAPALLWFLGDVNLTSQATQTVTNNPGLLTVSTTSNLTFTPTPSDVGKVLTCVLHQPDGYDIDLSVSLSLNIYLKPRVNLEITATDVQIGTDKVLRCIVQSILDPTILWFLDGVVISPSNNNYIMSGEFLTILTFEPSDNGAYSCIGENQAGLSNSSVQLTLTAYAPPGSPTIVFDPTSFPRENDTIAVVCLTENGVPTPNITWFKNGIRIFNGITTSVTATSVSSRLTFEVNYVNDIGAVFRCNTSNTFGTLSTTASIPVIHVQPTVDGTTILGDSVLYENRTNTFYCENLRSIPPASISWLLDGEILPGQPPVTIENDDETFKVSSNLTHVARYSDSGPMNLICRVSQSATSTSVDKLKQLIGYSIPRVSILDTAITAEKGTSLMLHCRVISELGQAVTWYKVSTSQTLTPPSRYMFNGPNVTILSVEVGDEGGYYCVATNDAGTSNNSNVAVVTVFANPVKPVITGLENPVLENTEMTIHCTTADGYPLPTIMWFRDDSLILNSPPGLHSSYSFIADFSTRNSMYTCIATNSYNSATSDPVSIADIYVPPSGIQLSGPSVVYATKMSVFLVTVTRVSPVPTFRWLVGMTIVTSTSNVTEHGDNLQIASYFSHVFEASDIGKNVTCVISQAATSTDITRSHPVTLHLLPTILNTLVHRDVELYTATSVTCQVSSTDRNYNVSWYKEGVLIDVDASNGKFSTSGDQLNIVSFQVSDSGLYACSATHQGGSSEIGQPTNLTGFGYPSQPVITTSHPSMILVEGETLTLNSSTSGGVPVPTLIWKRTRPGSPEEVLDSSSTPLIDGSNTFVFNEFSSVIHFRDNGSVYISSAENLHFTITNSILLRDVYVTPVPSLDFSVVNWDPANAIASVYEDQSYVFNGSIPRYNPKTAVIGWLVNDVNQVPNHIVEDITNQGEFTYTSSLSLVIPASLDGKMIKFMVSHPETTSSEVSITLEVIRKPRVSVSTASGLVVRGDDFSVTCDVDSTLEYNVTWTIQGNDDKLVNSAKYRITGGKGQTLTILSADDSDRKTYVCSAVNRAGTSDIPVNFFLVVYKGVGQPVIGKLNQNVIHGETVTIHCNSSGGDPPASLTWKRNDVTLTGANSIFGNDDSNPVSSSLSIVVDFARDKTAVYTCTAANAYSRLNTSGQFNDVYISSNTVSMTSLGVVRAGTQYTAQCQTSGWYLEPRPRWMLNDVEQTSGFTQQYETSNSGTSIAGTFTVYSNLTFTPTKENNGGDLVCVFDHTLYTGHTVNASRTLFVQFAPDEPIITGHDSDVLENTPQSLLCTVNSGNPRPTVRWLKNGNSIAGTTLQESTNDEGDYVTRNRLNFTTSLLGDTSATYTCHVQHVVRNTSALVSYGQIKALPSNIFITLPSEPRTASQPQIANYPNLLAGETYQWIGTVGRVQPEAIVAWKRGNTYLSSPTPVTSDNLDGTIRSVSTLSYAPSVTDNDIDLTFEVFHPATSQQTYTETTKLIVHGPPVAVISPTSVDIVVNSSYTVVCGVTSSLNSYTVRWYKANVELSSSDKYLIFDDNLRILSVQFTDEGEYTCSATNEAGDSARSNALTVSAISGAGAPAINGHDSSPKEGDVLPLVCTSIGGVPEPSVIWLKNGVVVDNTDFPSTTNGVTTVTNTWNFPVTFAERNTTLTCLASNSVANKTRDKTFEAVYIQPNFASSLIQGDTTLLAGNIYTHTINFPRVSPPPSVSWFIEEVALPASVPPVSWVITPEGYYNATASVTFIPAAEYNLKRLKAKVEHSETSQDFETTTLLTVKSAPSFPTISGFPTSTNTSIVGTTLQLVCSCQGGFPLPSLGWSRNNVPVGNIATQDSSQEPVVTTVTYTMTVGLIDKDAVIRCTAQNEINTLISEVSLRDVYVKAELSGGILGDANVIAGENTTLTCMTLPGYPQPVVEWTKDNQAMPVTGLSPGPPDSNGLRSVQSNVYFVPQLADTGKTVQCIVRQDLLPHTTSTSLILTVHGPPSASAHPATNTTLGQTVSFECSVVSTLANYNVTWYRKISNTQGILMTSVNEKYAVDNTHPVYKLWIYSIEVSDSGVYYCIAQSSAGMSTRAEVSLTVYTAPSGTTFEDGGGGTVNVTENGTIEKTCTTNVHPANTVTYTWSYAATAGGPESPVNSSYIVDNNKLLIPLADRTKAGIYICETLNSFGSDRATFTVNMQYAPTMDVGVQREFIADVGNVVTLTCGVIANPPPTLYTWTHQEEIIANTKILEVTAKAGDNNYICVATNGIGASEGFTYTITAQANAAPATGASTASTGISNAEIAAIVLGVIFFIIILVFICICCIKYKDKKKEEKAIRKDGKKTRPKYKPSSVVPDTDDRRSTLYPREKDPTYLFGPRPPPAPRIEQRFYPRELSAVDHHDYGFRGGYDNTFYVPAPGSEMDDMSIYRETGFRSHRRKLPHVLPPLTTHMYTGEAKRRKDRRKKNKKKRQQERQAGEGMENPSKSKDSSPPIVLDDNRPEKDAATDTKVLLGDQFKD